MNNSLSFSNIISQERNSGLVNTSSKKLNISEQIRASKAKREPSKSVETQTNDLLSNRENKLSLPKIVPAYGIPSSEKFSSANPYFNFSQVKDVQFQKVPKIHSIHNDERQIQDINSNRKNMVFYVQSPNQPVKENVNTSLNLDNSINMLSQNFLQMQKKSPFVKKLHIKEMNSAENLIFQNQQPEIFQQNSEIFATEGSAKNHRSTEIEYIPIETGYIEKLPFNRSFRLNQMMEEYQVMKKRIEQQRKDKHFLDNFKEKKQTEGFKVHYYINEDGTPNNMDINNIYSLKAMNGIMDLTYIKLLITRFFFDKKYSLEEKKSKFKQFQVLFHPDQQNSKFQKEDARDLYNFLNNLQYTFVQN